MIPLIKTQAFGNDFLLVSADAVAGVTDAPGLARRACDRHWGLGADGLLIVRETPGGADTQLLNADGSQAEVSGNGVRCAAAWLARRRSLPVGAMLVIGTMAGPKTLHLAAAAGARYTFRADMGPPTGLSEVRLTAAGEEVRAIVLRVGNPHCVVLGPATDARLRTVAAALAVHPFFPEGTNVELATVERPDRVRVLIWERGVGPTQASGTGACAAAVAAAFTGAAGRKVDVVSSGGTQHVEWTDETIWLTGWAEVVASIEWWE